MAIYTKKGDRGETGLFNGKRLLKDSLLIEAIGAIDEANSAWGVVGSHTENGRTKELINKIQSDLFTIGSILAGAKLSFPFSKTKYLEKEIDKLEDALPVLANFILPGGSKPACFFHLARSTTRRAERRLVALLNPSAVPSTLLPFINRLSDFAFCLARKENFDSKVKEWIIEKKFY